MKRVLELGMAAAVLALVHGVAMAAGVSGRFLTPNSVKTSDVKDEAITDPKMQRTHPSSHTFQASGPTQYSIQTSSGIRMEDGGLRFPDGTIQYTAPGESGWTGSGTVVRLTVPTDSAVIQSTLTVQGQDSGGYSLRSSSGVYLGGCVRFGDGTLQCSALGGGGMAGAMVRSTHTAVPPTSTASPEWTSIPGSTLALVTDSDDYMRIMFSCNVDCQLNSGCGISFGYLLDGEYHESQTASPDTGIKYIETDGSNISMPHDIGISHKTRTKILAGTHSVSMVWASTGGVTARLGLKMGGCALTYAQEPEVTQSGSGVVIPLIDDFGWITSGEIALQSCSNFPTRGCRAQSSTEFDIFTATSTTGWRNTRTGVGPIP